MNKYLIRLRALNLLFGVRFYLPFLIIYFSDITGSYAYASSVIALIFISSSIMELPTGMLSDYFSRRSIAIISAALFAVSIILYAIPTTITIIIGALVNGLYIALASGNNDAYVYELIKNKDSVDNYNKLHGDISSYKFITLAASAGVGSIALYYGASISQLIIATIPFALIPFLIWYTLPDLKVKNTSIIKPIQDIKNMHSYFKSNDKMRNVALTNTLSYGFGEASYQFRNNYIATLVPLWVIGVLQIMQDILASIGFRFSASITKSLGFFNTFVIGRIVVRSIIFLATLLNNIITPFLINIDGFSFGVNKINNDKFYQDRFTDSQRASLMSMINLSKNLFFGVMLILVGFIADIYTPRVAYSIFLFGHILTALPFIKIFRSTDTK